MQNFTSPEGKVYMNIPKTSFIKNQAMNPKNIGKFCWYPFTEIEYLLERDGNFCR